MKRLFSGIGLKDFIPPVYGKLLEKAENVLNKSLKRGRKPPFTYLPANCNVRHILDIGAADGAIARAALDSFPDSRIVCIEPVKSSFEQLKHNLARYGERVQYINCAISDFCGDTEINITTSKYANSLLPQSELYSTINPHIKHLNKEKVKTLTLDALAKELPSSFFDLVKIDVEGVELQLLKGGSEFFKNCVDMVLIEISLARDGSWNHQQYLDIFSTLDSYGLRFINAYDFDNSRYDQKESDLLLSQFDCVFRNINKLQSGRA